MTPIHHDCRCVGHDIRRRNGKFDGADRVVCAAGQRAAPVVFQSIQHSQRCTAIGAEGSLVVKQHGVGVDVQRGGSIVDHNGFFVDAPHVVQTDPAGAKDRMIRIVGENEIAVGRADPASLSRIARIHNQCPRTGEGHTCAVDKETGSITAMCCRLMYNILRSVPFAAPLDQDTPHFLFFRRRLAADIINLLQQRVSPPAFSILPKKT